MGRTEPAQGNRKLTGMDAPPAALAVELVKLKLSMLLKKARCYDIPYMNVTVGNFPMPIDKQGSNVTNVS